MFTAIFLSSLTAFILLVWFRGEAYLEYCRLFGLNKISHFEDFFEQKKNDVTLTYHGYLRQYHNSFFVRLVTCPICLTTWLALFLSILFLKLHLFPIIFIGGLILFGIVHKLLE
jgi:hypothetical protein